MIFSLLLGWIDCMIFKMMILWVSIDGLWLFRWKDKFVGIVLCGCCESLEIVNKILWIFFELSNKICKLLLVLEVLKCFVNFNLGVFLNV